MDSTILCMEPTQPRANDLPVYTYRQRGYINTELAGAWWKTYILGAIEPSDFFATIRGILIAYWSSYDRLLDYFLTDHILAYCFNLAKYRQIADRIPEDDGDVYWLQKNRNQPWNSSLTNKINCINKLDYKKDKTIESESVLDHALKTYSEAWRLRKPSEVGCIIRGMQPTSFNHQNTITQKHEPIQSRRNRSRV